MFNLIASVILIGSVNCQYQPASVDESESARNEILYPAARLHYVNIGPLLAGDYKFGYDTGKGPMGQSFREETRFADGTVKGSYGLIDENGQKGIVHYSAGKSTAGADIDSKLSTTPFTTQRQPRLIRQQNFKSNPQQLPVFKPANYLQSRVVYPVNMEPLSLETQGERIPTNEPIAIQVDKISPAVYKLPTPLQIAKNLSPVYTLRTPAERTDITPPTAQPDEIFSVNMLQTPAQRTDASSSISRTSELAQPVDIFSGNRLQTPAQRTDTSSSISRTSELAQPVDIFSGNRLQTPAHREPTVIGIPGSAQRSDIASPANRIQPAGQFLDRTQSVSKAPVSSQTALSSISQVQASAAAQVQSSMAKLSEMYKSLKRVPKKPSPSTKPPRVQMKTKQAEAKSYDSKFEEDYYDSGPAFVDIERLSYNIGTDRSSSVSKPIY